MRKSILIAGLCAALSLPAVTLVPTAASAACSGATTGTIVGGVGGALLGGLGGAVVGHEIGKSGCHRTTTHRYYRTQRSDGYRYRDRTTYRYGAAGCRTEDRDYYDANGSLVRRAVQVCD